MNIDSDSHKTLALSDGRLLSYAEYGSNDGFPIVGFHGTPGSRRMMKIFESAAVAVGVRLIAPDRPGYGLSHPQPHGSLLSYPKDIVELVEALGIGRFAVLGASGGGPFALVCAHELPLRLSAAAVVSGIGPLYLPNSTRDMVSMNRIMFSLGRFSPALPGFLLPVFLRSTLPKMEIQVQNGTSPTTDLSPEAFAIITADQREAIRTGGQGVAFDMKTLWRPWGFKFEDIHIKVCLWHGEADNLAPAMLAHYLAEHIPGCEATFYPGESHVDPLIRHAKDILTTVITAS